uniref:Uncharacterized protein n=1 Tax=viral metagenome TaxID=1070528 RepID=A0A6M3IW65_9ZZZZ
MSMTTGDYSANFTYTSTSTTDSSTWYAYYGYKPSDKSKEEESIIDNDDLFKPLDDLLDELCIIIK